MAFYATERERRRAELFEDVLAETAAEQAERNADPVLTEEEEAAVLAEKNAGVEAWITNRVPKEYRGKGHWREPDTEFTKALNGRNAGDETTEEV